MMAAPQDPGGHFDPTAGRLTGPADPQFEPSASYAINQALVRRLVSRLQSTSGESTMSYAPFTGQPLAAVPQSSVDDVADAAQQARTAQTSWAETPIEQRAEALLRLHDLVLDRQSDIMDLIQWESGKARKHAFEEVAHVALTARYYARTGRRYLRTERRYGLFPVLTRAEINRVPKGLVGIISPWNYPFTMAVSDGLPALMAGNTILHKPDSQTVLSALLGVELLEEAGFPADIWKVVSGPGAVAGPALIDEVDYVCFTGSTATGRLVGRQAASRLIGCSLELGGKNPMLVLADASIERASAGAVRACFSSAGQLCVATERMYVADSIYDRFVQRVVERARQLRLSASLSFEGDMGSLVSAAQLETVTRHVTDATEHGATVLSGGRPRPDIGPLFYEPTVLEGVSPTMMCFGEETFGPVVSVYGFHDEQEAVTLANSGSYGLNASIFSRDVNHARALARTIKAGTVNINEGYGATFGSIDAPMGGMRESGLGRRHAAEGIHRYTETQSVAAQRLVPIAPMLGMSDRRWAQSMTVTLRALRKTRRP
jgi:succinate-semialdehyde dehydrogenase/glutarate-semialdehyde dehydrogenase